jgi:hypothetical protein
MKDDAALIYARRMAEQQLAQQVAEQHEQVAA